MADETRYRNPDRPRGFGQDRGQDRGYDRPQDRGQEPRRSGGFGRDDGRDETGRGGRGPDRGSDDGTIAQRGFGNDRSGYDRGGERSFGGSYREERDLIGFEGSGHRSYDDRDEFGRGSFSRGDDDRGGFSRGVPGERGDVTGYRGERGFLERAGDEVASWFGGDEAARRRSQDARQGDEGAAHHRGRGPKGYQRSDERIRDDINDRLTDDPHLDASEIEVGVSGREVTLSGTVNTRFEKRHAEDLAEAVSGVAHVQNNLRVQAAGAGGASTSGALSGGGLTTSGMSGAVGSGALASDVTSGTPARPQRDPI